MAIPTLSGSYIDQTYQRLVQTNDTGTEFADGLGRSITFGTTNTGSLLVTASAVGNTITFTKGDGITFPLTINQSFVQSSSDIILTVLNQSGAQINKGIVVRITGSNNASDIPRIGIADWTNDNLSANTLGLVIANIANGDTGSVLTQGLFKGYNTNTPGWQTGQVVYLGANGSITGSAPTAPLHGVRLGQVVRDQSNNGSIYVSIDNGYELGELHDVIDTTTNSSYGDLLVRSGSVWINSKSLTGSYTLIGTLNATSITASLLGTASWTENFVSASSYVLNSATSSFATTISNTFIGDQTITGSIIVPTLVGTTDTPFVNFTVPYSSGIYKVTAQADPTTIDMGGINLPPVVEGASFTIIVAGTNFNTIVNAPLYPINAKGQTIGELANKTIHNFYGIDGYWHVGGLNTL